MKRIASRLNLAVSINTKVVDVKVEFIKLLIYTENNTIVLFQERIERESSLMSQNYKILKGI